MTEIERRDESEWFLSQIEYTLQDFIAYWNQGWAVMIDNYGINWSPASWQTRWILQIELGDRTSQALWYEEEIGPQFLN